MRFLPHSVGVCRKVLSTASPRRFPGLSRVWVGALVASAILGAAAISSPAKAEPTPEQAVASKSVDELVAAYILLAGVEDSSEREQTRQLLLYLIWLYGGNPWKLDPNWVPPIGGQP